VRADHDPFSMIKAANDAGNAEALVFFPVRLFSL